MISQRAISTQFCVIGCVLVLPLPSIFVFAPAEKGLPASKNRSDEAQWVDMASQAARQTELQPPEKDETKKVEDPLGGLFR